MEPKDILERHVAKVVSLVDSNPTEALMAFAIIENPDEGFTMVGIPEMPDSYEIRRAMLGHLGKMAAMNLGEGVPAMTFIAEAWSAGGDDYDPDDPDFVPPSQREDRIEVVMVVTVDPYNRSIGAFLPIHRTKDNFIRLEPDEANISDLASDAGVLGDFFPQYHAALGNEGN